MYKDGDKDKGAGIFELYVNAPFSTSLATFDAIVAEDFLNR